jgi:hypothetical protein
MIYSAEHNFLLLKNYKVGSTSLEVELSQVLDESAIVTPIYPENLLHKPRNFNNFHNHITYIEIENLLGKEALDKTESVVFVRNPFDVVLSHMYMSFSWSGIDSPSVSDVDKYFSNKTILNKIPSHKSRHIYTKDGAVMAKNVYKYENGLDQINKTLNDVGIDSIIINAKEKMYKPKDIKPVDIFKPRHIEEIYEDWSWEINKFDYAPSPMVL